MGRVTLLCLYLLAMLHSDSQSRALRDQCDSDNCAACVTLISS
jgi:hypothetical protein